jgi:hypothetical protein
MCDSLTSETILLTALEISNLQERTAYLARVSGGNVALQREVESLIDAHFAAATFLEHVANPLWCEPQGERVGDTIGRYRLLRKIGEGGFGTVFEAEQGAPMRRKVALKVIKPGMDSREIIARFETERQVLALMDHPHIARVYDAGTTKAGRPYFVMELVQGEPITIYCANRSLEIRERLELFIEVCAAVQHAHQKGVIHRDLKPSNILVSCCENKPVVKVIDFGIAKAIGIDLVEQTIFTQFGRMIGTPQYMSPEQAGSGNREVDTRSDIYSLGAIIYELVTGATPLQTDQLRMADYGEMQRLICDATPAKPSVRMSGSSAGAKGPNAVWRRGASRSLRSDLDWIILKALEKSPARRYESAGAMAGDLIRFLQHRPIEARPPGMAYVMMRFARRYRGTVLAGVMLLLVLLLGTIGTALGMKRALDAKSELEQRNADLDRQKLELIDYKERMAGLLESNQKMLGEISRMNTNDVPFPSAFEALRKENQNLLDKVGSEVSNQERYAEEISGLVQAKAGLEALLESQRQEIDAIKSQRKQVEERLIGLQRAIPMMVRRANGHHSAAEVLSEEVPLDRKTGNVNIPHTVILLTASQIDELQTLGTLTLTSEQWREIRVRSPQCPKRFIHILPVPWPDRSFGAEVDYVIELSRGRAAIPHRSSSSVSVEFVRNELFQDPVISLRTNDRGEFHLDGKLIPFPVLLKAFANSPQEVVRNDRDKVEITDTNRDLEAAVPYWLHVKLPAGAKPTDAVYHSRLKRLSDAADRIGIRHALLPE